MRSYLEIAHVSVISFFTQLPLGEQIFYPASEERTIGEFRSRTASFGTFSTLDRWRTESRARIDRSHLAPAPPRFSAANRRSRQLDFRPPAVIHFSTHTRKVKMAALTVSFAGKIGATAPRVANARAAGESPSAPRAPDASAPPSGPAEISPFSSRARERRLLGVPSSHPARGRATTRTSSTRPRVPNASFVDPRAAIVSPAVSRSLRPRPDHQPSRVLHRRDPRASDGKNPSIAGPARSAPLPASRRGCRRVRAPVPTPTHDD